MAVDGLTIGLIERIAVGFGLLWTVINFNQYFPIAQTSVENVNDRFFDESADRVAVDDANLPSVDVFLPAYHNRMWVVAYRDVPSSYLQSVLSDRERTVI